MAIRTANNQSLTEITAFPSAVALGGLVLIKELTASSSGTLDFVNGASDVVLDSTYKEYMFIFNNIHPETDDVDFQFNMSIDSGSNYNVTKTTTNFRANANEGDSSANVSYDTARDLAQGTGFQNLLSLIGNGNDECGSGNLHLFNPSSTVFVKHFISRGNLYLSSDYTRDEFVAGYGNTTSAVDAIQFKMNSGEIQGGTISLYGIN